MSDIKIDATGDDSLCVITDDIDCAVISFAGIEITITHEQMESIYKELLPYFWSEL